MKFHIDVGLCSTVYNLHLQKNSLYLNVVPQKILIFLHLMDSLQVWRSSKKATHGASTLTDVLFLVTLSFPPSDTSTIKTPDPVSLPFRITVVTEKMWAG